ncbi:MAG: cysteine--tRNA ligase [Lachnospiraceae bacterium]|nr:cysteine--tRNA ligase [Lachnospiraceae bacterium]
MKFYNTMTREKEEFTPRDGSTVKIYSCGPTVYSYAHIGNMRTYIFMDELRRALKRNGYTLLHAMNITDVGHLTSDGDSGEDKMSKAAKEQKKSPYEIAAHYTEVFLRDIDSLNIDRPELIPHATDNIPEMIEFVQGLWDKGFAYETSDGIYYDISKFPEYGKLSRLNLDEQQAGARVEVNEEKRHPADFAVWKKAPKEHIMQWPSPWGMGYPGWHIECSAMGLKYLGEYIDIHTGGVDHIPVHHENEIAQSCGYLGHEAVHVWMHGEFMNVDGGKMSKSLKNCYTLAELKEKGYSPLDFRYFCLNAHYHQKLNFTFEGMDSAKKSLSNLRAAVKKHKGGEGEVNERMLAAFKNRFDEAVNDDLNIPKALGILWELAKVKTPSDAVYRLILDFDTITALDLDKEPEPEAVKEPEIDPVLDAEVKEQIALRAQAKKEKNYVEADRIRKALADCGILLIDTPQGTTWKLAD